MNEITSQGSGRSSARRKTKALRSGIRSLRRSDPSRSSQRGDFFDGVRIVLHECDRRAAVLRSLSSLRSLAQRGAEVVLFDGNSARSSADGSRQAIRRLFPFVTLSRTPGRAAAQGNSFPLILEAAVAPLTVDRPEPRWILGLRADLTVDRFQLQALLLELDGLPEGSLLVPRVMGPGGEPARCGGAWIARRGDLLRSPLDALSPTRSSGNAVLALRPIGER